jgi:hypothetical protein
VTENLANGFDWRPVVVQPRTETTAKSVEAVPLNARVFELRLDVLGPKRCQVEREDLRLLRTSAYFYPLCYAIDSQASPDHKKDSDRPSSDTHYRI